MCENEKIITAGKIVICSQFALYYKYEIKKYVIIDFFIFVMSVIARKIFFAEINPLNVYISFLPTFVLLANATRHYPSGIVDIFNGIRHECSGYDDIVEIYNNVKLFKDADESTLVRTRDSFEAICDDALFSLNCIKYLALPLHILYLLYVFMW